MKKIEIGTIWGVSFDPSIGQEIKKTRPALVLSNSYYNLASGTVFVVPLTSQVPKEGNMPFYVRVEASDKTGLDKKSFANVSQFRAVSKYRFIEELGSYPDEKKDEIMKKFLDIVDFNVLDLRYF